MPEGKPSPIIKEGQKITQLVEKFMKRSATGAPPSPPVPPGKPAGK